MRGIDTTIKCVIIEDEDFATKLLENYISKHPLLVLEATFESPVDFIEAMGTFEFDLLYLDIYMPEMTGLELLTSFPLECETIITTASPDHAIDCFPLQVIDYLLKPIKINRFIAATQRAIEQIRLKQIPTIGVQQNSTLEPQMIKKNHFMVKADKRLIKVNIADILYIEAAWEYVKIHTSKESIMVMSQIKKYQEDLEDYNFFRIHRSFLINLDHISFIEGNQVAIDKIKLPISRNYKQDLLTKVNSIL